MELDSPGFFWFCEINLISLDSWEFSSVKLLIYVDWGDNRGVYGIN